MAQFAVVRALAFAPLLAAACGQPPRAQPDPPKVPRVARIVEPEDAGREPEDAGVDAALEDAAPEPVVSDDPRDLHIRDREKLLALFEDRIALEPFDFGLGPARLNQGNPDISVHAIGKRTCLEGLRGTTLQTPEQRARCGGKENMVPIYEKGDKTAAKFCIDVFEFPNKACELPIVWPTPTQAASVCKAQGKRLCDQEEWKVACRADPAGGKDSLYAYGDDLDLAICHTNKSRVNATLRCGFQTLKGIWDTCATDTEPSGAYPKCRSRFGVYDLHGNVAEIMTRVDYDRVTYSQLKGSAFFYVDVARRPFETTGGVSRYPDHCNFDPRWHVEPIRASSHVNYHLGFRCCRNVEP